jgi:hypothetical protein
VSISTTVANTYTLHAAVVSAAGEITGSPVDITFSHGPVAPDSSYFSVSAFPGVIADGAHYQTVTVSLRDQYGNPVAPSLPGSLSVSAVQGDVEGEVHTVRSSGEVRGDYLLDVGAQVSGPYQVTVSYLAPDAAVARGIGHRDANDIAVFVPGPASVLTSTLASSREFVEANSTDFTEVTVSLFDALSNARGAGGDDVAITTTLGTVTDVVDKGDGTYQAHVTSSSAGEATLGFAIAGTPAQGPPPRTASVTFVATPVTPVLAYANARAVVGTAEAGTVISVYAPGGAQICEVATTDEGDFACTGLNPAPAHGDVLTVIATEPHGFQSAPASVVVDAVPPEPPVVDPTDGTQVTGSDGEPGGTVIVRDPDDGTVLCETEVAPDGTFACGPLTPRPGDDTPIDIVIVDPSDNSSAPVSVVVDSSAPEPPVVDPTDGSVLYGDAEPGSHVVVTDDEGATVCETDAEQDGTWDCEPSRPLADGETLTVTAGDDAGNVSAGVIVVTDRSELPPPGVDPSNGTSISGDGIPGYTVAVTFPDGTVVRDVVDDDGHWSVSVPRGYNPEDGDELRVVHETRLNRVQIKSSTVTPLVLDRIAPERPAPAPTGGGTIRGTGEAGTVVIVTDADGVEIGRATVDSTGTWTVRLPSRTAVGDLVTITLHDVAGNVSEEFTVRVGLVAVSADKSVVMVGETITFAVTNLQPSERSSGTVRSIPVPLGEVVGDANGAAQYSWTVPANAELGVHTFHVTGPFSGEATTQSFQVVPLPVPEPVAEVVVPPSPVTEVVAPPVEAPPVVLAETGARQQVLETVGWTMAALVFGFLLVVLAGRLRRRREDAVS